MMTDGQMTDGRMTYGRAPDGRFEAHGSITSCLRIFEMKSIDPSKKGLEFRKGRRGCTECVNY